MSHCVSNIIAIRMGGVFSGPLNMDVVKEKIVGVIEGMGNEKMGMYAASNILACMSQELVGPKGSYVVIAGVFNYWFFYQSSEFSKTLSAEFDTEVVHTYWDEEDDTVQCQIFLRGCPMLETSENPIGRILRRIS